MFFPGIRSNSGPGIFFAAGVLGFIMGHCIFLVLIILVIHQCRKRRVFQGREKQDPGMLRAVGSGQEEPVVAGLNLLDSVFPKLLDGDVSSLNFQTQ